MSSVNIIVQLTLSKQNYYKSRNVFFEKRMLDDDDDDDYDESDNNSKGKWLTFYLLVTVGCCFETFLYYMWVNVSVIIKDENIFTGFDDGEKVKIRTQCCWLREKSQISDGNKKKFKGPKNFIIAQVKNSMLTFLLCYHPVPISLHDVCLLTTFVQKEYNFNTENIVENDGENFLCVVFIFDMYYIVCTKLCSFSYNAIIILLLDSQC